MEKEKEKTKMFACLTHSSHILKVDKENNTVKEN
jgi:hypothetical protein